MAKSNGTPPMPDVADGTVIGYVVVCWNEPGIWADDWDGNVHSTYDDAVEAFRLCSDAGYDCALTTLTTTGTHREVMFA